MDHHCLFLYKCVAARNHRVFVQLILVVLVAMVMTLCVSLRYLQVTTAVTSHFVNVFVLARFVTKGLGQWLHLVFFEANLFRVSPVLPSFELPGETSSTLSSNIFQFWRDKNILSAI